MRKDYEAVAVDEIPHDESAFVEKYWTRKWDDFATLPKADTVTQRREYKIMRPYLDKLPKGAKLLDGGCGLGAWVVYLVNQGFDVKGLDLSRKTISLLQQRLPRYHFEDGDIRHTGLPDASLDGYFSWGVFEHFENGLGDCINEAQRILKPGAYLFISVPFYNLRHKLRDAMGWGDKSKESTQSHPKRFYQWRLSKRELTNELSMRGFDVLSVTPIHKMSGVERFMQWELGWSYKPSWSTWQKKLHTLARYGLGAVMPSAYINHMVMAVAQKRKAN